MHDHRVDAAPDIVNHSIAGDLDPASLGIHLGLANRTAIRKDRVVHFIVGDDGKSAIHTKARRLLRQLEKVEAAVAARRRETPIGKCYLVCGRFENTGGNVLALGDQLRRRLGEQRRGVAHRPAGVRATAETDAVCVAGDEIDAVDRDGEQGRDDLPKAGLVTLAVCLSADDDLDPARRRDSDFGAFARRPFRRFDVVCQTQSEQLSSGLGLPPASRKTAQSAMRVARSILGS